MGLFSKKQSKQDPSETAAAEVAQQVFDESYREELRQLGRQHFKQLLDEGTVDLKQDVDSLMKQVTSDIKEHMIRQLDETVTRIHSELTNHMNERITEYNRLASETQDLLAQSLNQNAQAVREKYQQLSAAMQQVISSQEVAMVGLFEGNKSRVVALQNEQDKALQDLSASTNKTRQQSDQLGHALQQSITQQSASLSQVYQENMSRVMATKEAQTKALETLNASAMALEQKHQQLAQLLERSVANHKAMLVETINDNMARIIEHYLIGALGEQTDLKEQLPSILEQLEKNKQAMVDDMKL